MFWVPLAMAAAGAAAGMSRDRAQAKQMRRYNEGQAETTRYSPWTGMKGEITPHTSDPMGAGLTGALSGYAMGANVAGKMNQTPQKVEPPQPEPQTLEQPMSQNSAVDYNNGAFGSPKAPSMWDNLKKMNPGTQFERIKA